MKLPKLPEVIIVKNNTRVIPEFIKEQNISALFQIVQDNLRYSSTGISPFDFPSENHFLHMVRSSMLAIQYKMESTGEYIGFILFAPSEICRSCRPVSGRGLTVLAPSAHNIGLGQWARATLSHTWAKDVGIPCLMSRSATTNKLGK